MAKRVLVGMSGGVDSSVAAALLVKQGYEVTGVTMKLAPCPDKDEAVNTKAPCCSAEDIEDARSVAARLGVAYYVWNGEEVFKREVIDQFTEEYTQGRTPNPCIVCNEKIKFGWLLEKAKQTGIDYIATGHYARVRYEDKSGRYEVLKGLDPAKDQSYVLYNLSQEQLSHMLLPLGGYTKEQVRGMAEELKLSTARKADSQDICFVTRQTWEIFFKKNGPAALSTGPILDNEGNLLGEHHGLAYYTVGQRRGLGDIVHSKPLFVVAIDAERNAIIVGEEEELCHSIFMVERVNWVSSILKEGDTVFAKIRSRHQVAEAKVFPLPESKMEVRFATPQRAITAGQSVVFYDDYRVLGGGVISCVVKEPQSLELIR